jgi:hypothetical protein
MAISLAQSAVSGNTSGSIANYARTFGSSTTAGDLLLALVSYEGGSVSGVSDSNGNTYSKAIGYQTNGNVLSTEIWYCLDATGGSSNQVTVTFGTGGSAIALTILDFTGVAASNPLDQTNKNTQTSSSFSSGSVTTSTNGELYVGVLAYTVAGYPVTAESSWTQPYDVEFGDIAGAHQYYIDPGAGAGTYAATWTPASSAIGTAVIATFKPAAGGVTAQIWPYIDNDLCGQMNDLGF